MARVKPKRHGVVTDMTAMTDVAFLLLTFFILTAQFKKPDAEGYYNAFIYFYNYVR